MTAEHYAKRRGDSKGKALCDHTDHKPTEPVLGTSETVILAISAAIVEFPRRLHTRLKVGQKEPSCEITALYLHVKDIAGASVTGEP